MRINFGEGYIDGIFFIGIVRVIEIEGKEFLRGDFLCISLF